MNTFLKNLGILMIVIGAGFLAVPFFLGTTANLTLAIGLAVILIGLIVFIITNKRIE